MRGTRGSTGIMWVGSTQRTSQKNSRARHIPLIVGKLNSYFIATYGVNPINNALFGRIFAPEGARL